MNNKNIVKYIKLPRALMFLLSFTTLYICPFLRTLFSPEALSPTYTIVPKIIWIGIWPRLDPWQRYIVCLSLWRIQYVLKSQTYADASIPDVAGSVFMQRFSLFLAHCTLPLICLLTLYVNTSHLFLGSLCPSSIVHYLYPSSMPLPWTALHMGNI